MKKHVKQGNKVKQLQSLKVFNAVKCGPDENMFFQDKDYTLFLDGMFIHIESKKTGAKVTTPITNTPWFVLLSNPVGVFKENVEDTLSEQSTSFEDIGGAKQAQNKRTKVAKPKLPQAE